MASDQGAVATAFPPFVDNLPDTASLLASTLPISHLDADPTRSKSLKRPRSNSSQLSTTSTSTGRRLSPVPKSPRLERAAPSRPLALVPDENSIEGEHRIDTAMNQVPASSPAPASSAMEVETQGTLPPPTANEPPSEPPPAPVPAPAELQISTASQSDSMQDTSPTSIASQSSLTSTAGPVSTNAIAPSAMGAGSQAEPRAPGLISQDGASNTPLQSDPRSPVRGMSMPNPARSQQLVPRSPSQKKHKCPYCETEFTRHHNLKSHLLTHSQEKPYICQTCSMRFRRLHDLKRHSKLHTGERPHICPKCDRKFARGDALARHSKGQGGCAGRRSSMGSFGGDDDYDGQQPGEDTVMDGVLYGEPPEGDLSDDERRRSLPSIKAQLAPGHGMQEHFARSRGPSTYPPAGPRPAPGSLYPPSVDHGSSSSGTSPSMPGSVLGGHTPNTSVSSLPMSAGSGSIYSQGGAMTESPKPLSPSSILHPQQPGHDPNAINRQRSPSHPGQFAQQHYGQRQPGRATSPGQTASTAQVPGHGTKLPTFSTLAPPEPKSQFTMQSNSQGQTSPQGSLPGLPGSASYPGSTHAGHAPHHQSSGSGDSSTNLFASGERGMWNYIQSLEDKMKQLADKVVSLESKERTQEDRIARLVDEVGSLRQQLGSQPQQPNA